MISKPRPSPRTMLETGMRQLVKMSSQWPCGASGRTVSTLRLGVRGKGGVLTIVTVNGEGSEDLDSWISSGYDHDRLLAIWVRVIGV